MIKISSLKCVVHFQRSSSIKDLFRSVSQVSNPQQKDISISPYQKFAIEVFGNNNTNQIDDKEFWNDAKNQRQYFEWLYEKLSSNKDQTTTSKKNDYQLQSWKFNSVPPGFWKDSNNQKQYLNWVSSKINIKDSEDWYKVTPPDFVNTGGAGLLWQYEGSVFKVISSNFPDYDWQEWKFDVVLQQSWSMLNQRKYLDWIGKQLNIKQPEDWYNVKADDIKQKGGVKLIRSYGESVAKLIMKNFPEYDLLAWKFETVPRSFWNDVRNHKRYINWLAEKLNIKSLDDWYQVKRSDFEGAEGLLMQYNNSHVSLITSFFPEHNWQIWKFSKVPSGFWNDASNLKSFIDWAAQQLMVKELDDWYYVSQSDLKAIYKHSFNLPDVLSRLYPNHPWDIARFDFTKKSEGQLLQIIKRLFPGEEILYNFRHPRLRSSFTNVPLELDIFLPSLNLAYEYQGEQHYGSGGFQFSSSLGDIQKRDKEKQRLCEREGITLIQIPYWWNRSAIKIVATTKKYRPDLLQLESTHGIEAIDETMPRELKRKESEQATTLLLSGRWDWQSDPTGWWASEKYDGIRAYWDGTKFLSRYNNMLAIPEYIKQSMPPVALDGEIWFGRKSLQECLSVVRKSVSTKWKQFKFVVFDAPGKEGIFEERYKYLTELIEPNHPHVMIAEQIKCESREHLEALHKIINYRGGEGVMLRKPQSDYVGGRSGILFKAKSYLDEDAVIVGKRSENIWECQEPSGLVFLAPCINNCKPKIGSIVKYKCSSKYFGRKPLKPRIFEIREDLKVSDILRDYYHYELDNTQNKGHKCSSCGKEILNNSLCIVTTATTLGDEKKQEYFCINANECITSFVKTSPMAPAFSGKVFIPPHLEHLSETELSIFKGISWVNCETYKQLF